MRSTHSSAATIELARASTWRLRRGGHLQVLDGRVWLTFAGGGADHVLASGESLTLAAGADVVLEPWRHDAPARLAWTAAPARRQAPPGLARGGRRLALAGRAGLAAFAAAWRNAAPSASRAHGCISAGESTASPGACQ